MGTSTSRRGGAAASSAGQAVAFASPWDREWLGVPPLPGAGWVAEPTLPAHARPMVRCKASDGLVRDTEAAWSDEHAGASLERAGSRTLSAPTPAGSAGRGGALSSRT